MPLGPDERDIARAMDTVDALQFYEADRFRLYVVDDSPVPRDLRSRFPERQQARLTVLPHPRRGRGHGWAAGNAVGVLAAIREAMDDGAAENPLFYLKLDADALVIAPFSARLAAAFAERPDAGLFGSLARSKTLADQRYDVGSMAANAEKLMRQVAVWRRTAAGGFAIQAAFLPDWRIVRDTLRRAMVHGFRFGEHAYGGAYAISARCALALREAGLLDRPRAWLRTHLVEDLILTICAYAGGLEPQDLSGVGEPFSIRWKGLAARPEVLAERGHAIIHSVKSYGGVAEEDVRQFFQSRRSHQPA